MLNANFVRVIGQVGLRQRSRVQIQHIVLTNPVDGQGSQCNTVYFTKNYSIRHFSVASPALHGVKLGNYFAATSASNPI